MKRCNKCERELPIESFAKKWEARDGRNTQCRDCNRAYYQKNRARRIAYQRAYRLRRASEAET